MPQSESLLSRLKRYTAANRTAKRQPHFQAERRGFERFPVRMLISVVMESGEAETPRVETRSVEIVNISQSGACIATDSPLLAESGYVRILAPWAGPNLLKSRIVHSRREESDGLLRYGVEFESLLTEDQFAELISNGGH